MVYVDEDSLWQAEKKKSGQAVKPTTARTLVIKQAVLLRTVLEFFERLVIEEGGEQQRNPPGLAHGPRSYVQTH